MARAQDMCRIYFKAQYDTYLRHYMAHTQDTQKSCI